MASKKMGALVQPPAKASKVAAETQPSPKENDYEAEDHARTLTRAGEIHNDADKMKKAMKHLKKQKKAIKSVDDIKAYHQAKYGRGGTAPQDGEIDEAGE